jgi:hypothetical protein
VLRRQDEAENSWSKADRCEASMLRTQLSATPISLQQQERHTYLRQAQCLAEVPVFRRHHGIRGMTAQSRQIKQSKNKACAQIGKIKAFHDGIKRCRLDIRRRGHHHCCWTCSCETSGEHTCYLTRFISSWVQQKDMALQGHCPHTAFRGKWE